MWEAHLDGVDNKTSAVSTPTTPKGAGGGSAITKINPKNIGIDWDFISKKEGGSKLNGYVPDPDGSKSGVTIATGFDIGARSSKDLEGLSPDLQAKLTPYLGLHGQDAVAMLRNQPLKITAKEAKEIDKMSKGTAVNKLQKEWNKRAEETGGKKFGELSSAQQTIAASVAFQYGSLSKTPNFKKAMQSGDWSKAINELENFGDSYSSRRNSEAQYLQASLDPSKRTQAFNGLQTANAEGKMGGANGMTVIAPNVTKVNHNSTQSMVAQGRAVDLSRQSKIG
ncbi:MAG: pesticin [Pelagibacteraceae bacterium]|nr:pesticin [Pelagibacteraceae bacterium]